MKFARSHSSLAVAAAGLFGFVVLVSGVWHPKVPAGGLTQVERSASVILEDGTVLELTTSENDQDILKKRRMHGWNGHEYKRLFVMADGEEVDLGDAQPAFAADSEELSAGDRLLLAANTTDLPENALLGANRRAVLAGLQVDDKTRDVASEVDAKDRVSTNVIDERDRVFNDPKDGKDFKDSKDSLAQPVFALTADESALADGRLDMILLGGGDGGGSDWGSMRTPGGLNTSGGGNGGVVTVPPIGVAVPEPSSPAQSLANPSNVVPPIGVAVPEPSALRWLGVAGAVGLCLRARRRRAVAA